MSESEPETLVPEEKSPSLDDSEFIENLSESEPEILVPEEKSPSLDDSDTTKKSSQTQDSNSMSLKDRISEDIKLAMKAKDKIRLETVRSIKKALIEKEVAVRPTGQDSLTQEQELELLSQQAKQRRDSIEQYRNGGRDDLADKEAQELAIIETYLPKQLSDEEIGAVVDEIITSVGATTVKDLGKVMGAVMQQLKGKADGKKIQTMVKSKLEAK
ncbi:MAG: GatB/YqeY domain-containing protein [Hydrococcus sp. Prado102]|nr:GatB/YqeY domain-containing protein [Hydrococcus sp. Prado102]